jgi:hypothetical protein
MKKVSIIIVLILLFTLVSCSWNKDTKTTWDTNTDSKEAVKTESENPKEVTNNEDTSNLGTKYNECVKWCEMLWNSNDSNKGEPESKRKLDCDNLCYSQVWIETNDITYCAKIKEALFSSSCYSKIASNKKDASICENIKDSVLLNSCYSIVAQETKDAKICDKIDSDIFKTWCIDWTKE